MPAPCSCYPDANPDAETETPCVCAGEPALADDRVKCPRCEREHEHIDVFMQFSRYASHWSCPSCGCRWASGLFSKTT